MDFNIIFRSQPRSSKWAPPFRFPNKNTLYISLLLVCATRFPPLILLRLINTNNLWSGTKIMKFSVKFFHPPVTSSVLDQNILPITTFSNTFNLCSSFKIEGQVSYPYVTSGVIIFISSKGQPTICWIYLFGDRNKNWCTKIKQSKLQFNIQCVFCIQYTNRMTRS